MKEPVVIRISLKEQHDAGCFDHVYVWMKKLGLDYTPDHYHKDGVWTFHGVTNVIGKELPEWMKVSET